MGESHTEIQGVRLQTVVEGGWREHEQGICLLLTGVRCPCSFHIQPSVPFLEYGYNLGIPKLRGKLFSFPDLEEEMVDMEPELWTTFL